MKNKKHIFEKRVTELLGKDFRITNYGEGRRRKDNQWVEFTFTRNCNVDDISATYIPYTFLNKVSKLLKTNDIQAITYVLTPYCGETYCEHYEDEAYVLASDVKFEENK